MAEEVEVQVDVQVEAQAPVQEIEVEVKDDFYRDSFGKVLFILISFMVALALLIMVSAYIYVTRPTPVVFPVEDEWRVQPSVPVDQPYLSDAEVLQWVSDVIPKGFTNDFKNYNDQLPEMKQYFSADGWSVFLNQLNIYENYTNVQTEKMFITAAPSRAPSILQRGKLEGDRYYWAVLMPVDVTYVGQKPTVVRTLMLKVVVVRIPTLSNLSGVVIDNLIVDASTESLQPGSS